ncbi:unnamed protein product [Acanthoscelides obtectus]|uniref:Uncharacterized protein n=1 Tax=Acanthoscelides obtectus TaxID=200917 RepID=A0A9P0JNB9_ACAOB|nr:unnamed protein product [Acanthoscelides obtectus]CAK1628992.1 hypothetical protein AOBTE_LOCUS5515 [Acanthoscelides obtectus]
MVFNMCIPIIMVVKYWIRNYFFETSIVSEDDMEDYRDVLHYYVWALGILLIMVILVGIQLRWIRLV